MGGVSFVASLRSQSPPTTTVPCNVHAAEDRPGLVWIDYTPTVAGDCLLSIELAMGISVVLRVRLATCLTPTVCVRVQTTVAALRFKMLRFESPWRRDPLLLAVVLRRLVVCVLPGIHAQCELHMPLSLPQVPSTTTPGDETHATIHGKGLKLHVQVHMRGAPPPCHPAPQPAHAQLS